MKLVFILCASLALVLVCLLCLLWLTKQYFVDPVERSVESGEKRATRMAAWDILVRSLPHHGHLVCCGGHI